MAKRTKASLCSTSSGVNMSLTANHSPMKLRAQYDILKKLTQGSLPADDWMMKLQSQLHLCNYKPEMEEVLPQGPVPVWLTG